MEVVVEVVEAVGDVPAVLLGGIHRRFARRRLAGGHRRDEGRVDGVRLGLDLLPVGLGVALGAGRRLLPRVGLAPALLRLLLVLVPEAVAEELLHLLGRGGLVAHLSLQCSVDGHDDLAELVEPGHDRVALTPQVGGCVIAAVEQLGDVLERQLEAPVHDDLLQPRQVGVGVEPVAGRRALTRHEQADLVVVVQGAHRHAEDVGDLPHRPGGHLRHQPRVRRRIRGHGSSVAPHVT